MARDTVRMATDTWSYASICFMTHHLCSGGMNPIPTRRLSPTCARSNFSTSASLHRLGTGLYAALNVPTVCAHSPGRGDCASAAPAPPPSLPRILPRSARWARPASPSSICPSRSRRGTGRTRAAAPRTCRARRASAKVERRRSLSSVPRFRLWSTADQIRQQS
jgi:hypothetical protein